jgi:hypothetical protein
MLQHRAAAGFAHLTRETGYTEAMRDPKSDHHAKECPRCWFNLRRWLLKHSRERVDRCPHCGAGLVKF